MAPASSRLALAGLVGVLVAGCGGGSERAGPTATVTSTAPRHLDRFLMRADEIPGLTPVQSPRTDSRDPFEMPEDGIARLRRSGYLSTTQQPAQGDSSAGFSLVMLFRTEAGARDWMDYETSLAAIRVQIPGATIERFRVPAVPSAEGWTGPDRHGNAIGQLYWIQGRCMLVIGLEDEGPRVERLRAGVEAIHRRTGGTCPD